MIRIKESITNRDEIIKTIFAKEVLYKSTTENVIVRNALFSCSTDTDWDKVYYMRIS